MSGAAAPGTCGVHGGWSDATLPTGADHGSGSAPGPRICLPCALDLVNRGGGSDWLREQVNAMEARAT